MLFVQPGALSQLRQGMGVQLRLKACSAAATPPALQARCSAACPTTSLQSTRAATWASCAPSQTCECCDERA